MAKQAVLLAALTLAVGGASAQSLADQLKMFGITKEIECVVAGKPLGLTSITSQAKTIGEWNCILVGNLNRSAVIKLLGKPTSTHSGFLYYKERVLDPDTGDLHRLQVFFGKGEGMPASNVAYFDEASFQEGAKPFSK